MFRPRMPAGKSAWRKAFFIAMGAGMAQADPDRLRMVAQLAAEGHWLDRTPR